MNLRHATIGILGTGSVIAASMLMPGASYAQDPKVKQAMELLIAKTGKLGPPKLEGTDAIAGKSVPALHFGMTKMNNNFAVVDEVKAEVGGTATLFVRAGEEYVRVTTNVPRPDSSGRAIGTILDPVGPAIAMVKKGEAYYGEAAILGVPYVTGYEPIRDAERNVIGIYYVGYAK
jgi:hypothetical protein